MTKLKTKTKTKTNTKTRIKTKTNPPICGIFFEKQEGGKDFKCDILTGQQVNFLSVNPPPRLPLPSGAF